MYRNKDKETLKIFKKHINKYEVDKNTSYDLYYKNCCLFDLWDFARTKSSSTISIGYGNVLSNIFILLESENQTDRLRLIKSMISSLNKNLDDVYVTFYNKTNINNLNFILLKKELELLEPKVIIYFDDFNFKNINDSIEIISISVSKIKIKDDKTLEYDDSNFLGDLKKYIERV